MADGSELKEAARRNAYTSDRIVGTDGMLSLANPSFEGLGAFQWYEFESFKGGNQMRFAERVMATARFDGKTLVEFAEEHKFSHGVLFLYGMEQSDGKHVDIMDIALYRESESGAGHDFLLDMRSVRDDGHVYPPDFGNACEAEIIVLGEVSKARHEQVARGGGLGMLLESLYEQQDLPDWLVDSRAESKLMTHVGSSDGVFNGKPVKDFFTVPAGEGMPAIKAYVKESYDGNAPESFLVETLKKSGVMSELSAYGEYSHAVATVYSYEVDGKMMSFVDIGFYTKAADPAKNRIVYLRSIDENGKVYPLSFGVADESESIIHGAESRLRHDMVGRGMGHDKYLQAAPALPNWICTGKMLELQNKKMEAEAPATGPIRV